METKEKATEGIAPPAASRTSDERNNNPILAFIKALIVFWAMLLLVRAYKPPPNRADPNYNFPLTTKVAEWLIKYLGLRGV